MNCLCCGKKMRGIKEDGDYSKCWNERNMYYDLYLRLSKNQNYNPKTLEYYKIKSCLK